MVFTTSIELLHALRTQQGLFLAAPAASTGYNKAWIRDNVYATLGLETIAPDVVTQTYHRILDILLKHESKIDYAIREKPTESYQYIHARYHPETLHEFYEPWGNKQNDAVGIVLFKIGDLLSKGFPILRNDNDKRIIQKLVDYLRSIEYWHDADNGVWEEAEEIHASSVGACVAGLLSIRTYVHVPQFLIEKGCRVLEKLLPNESSTKQTDLALLSLVYPFRIASHEQATKILGRVESHLVRNRGVIRYAGDQYYNKNGEAEWCMGFPWLAIIYKERGNKEKYDYYMQKTLECMNERSELPELYFANSSEHNDNSPLGWAQSLYLVAAL